MINYQDFDYNGSRITFSLGSEVYVNATKMAKPFGKQPAHWLRLPSAQEYIKALCDVRGVNYTNLVIAKKGNYGNGGEQGTWFHKDVAIEFARWLAPTFAIWCNDRILELLTTGKTGICNVAKIPAPTVNVTKDDSIVTNAMRYRDKDYSISDVSNMIVWAGKYMKRQMFVGWLYEHKFLRRHETGVDYPTEMALALGLFVVLDRCKRGAHKKLVKPRVRITMDGANYFINVLQHGLINVIK